MELLNNTVTKILQIVNNYAVPMYEIWENNKNQMVNQKQFKGRKKKVVCNFNWNRQNKIRRLTMLICPKNFKQNLKESNECSPIWNRRKEWQRARGKE